MKIWRAVKYTQAERFKRFFEERRLKIFVNHSLLFNVLQHTDTLSNFWNIFKIIYDSTLFLPIFMSFIVVKGMNDMKFYAYE